MTHVLLALWNLNVFDETTILRCHCQRRDYRGVSYASQDDFYPVGINHESPEPHILAKSFSSATIREITLPAVISINGMEPRRFASVFNLNWDGTNQYTGKKRGRKRKSVV
jgi:hypothetical protein